MLDLNTINQFISKDISGLPRVDWSALDDHLNAIKINQDDHELWTSIARHWLNHLSVALSSSFTVIESEHFLVLSSQTKRTNDLFLGFCERIRQRILRILDGVASDELFGKHVILMFDDQDEYYRYIDYFNHEQGGTYGLSAGVSISKGYDHIALNDDDLTMLEYVVTHELAHHFVSHLPLPMWLNEGIAVLMESIITGSTVSMSAEQFDEHTKFWNKDTIQEFWLGSSFFRPDEGQELSYHLAEILVHSLTQNFDDFVALCTQAHFDDAGEKAAQAIAGGSLSLMIEHFFGEGDWAPQPSTWPAKQNQTEDVTLVDS